MYFVKAKKQFDEQDASDVDMRPNRYQRSDTARLVLQAVGQPTLNRSTSSEVQESKPKPQVPSEITQLHRTSTDGSMSMSSTIFKPEELPDGACFRPRKDLQNLRVSNGTCLDSGPPSSKISLESKETVWESMTSTSWPVDRENEKKSIEFVRRAEYVGTFSVSGSDKQAREKQMETQLQQMRDARNVTPVKLLITQEGVKVIDAATESKVMEHSLKRIWYATCDPEFCQFSFLAREPKTSAEVQYCHAFLTKTAQEAEELISIMGDAFKATGPPETKKAPTFHELIEKQVHEQQAKFRAIEKEAKSALQKKLTEIATPTPFSELAQQRMLRRKSDETDGATLQENRMWAKQLMVHGVSHAIGISGESITTRLSTTSNANNINRRSEIPMGQNPPRTSPFKRNSVPIQMSHFSQASSGVPSSSPSHHPLSAQAIKESVDHIQSTSKFKGSPVTALKNEIDKRLVMEESLPIELMDMLPQSHARDKVIPNPAMANRPLPSPPGPSNQDSPPKSKAGRGSRARRSMDDNSLPQSQLAQVKLRNSPRRGQQRPMSEIAIGSSHYQQQRHSLLQNLTSSVSGPADDQRGGGLAGVASTDGVYFMASDGVEVVPSHGSPHRGRGGGGSGGSGGGGAGGRRGSKGQNVATGRVTPEPPNDGYEIPRDAPPAADAGGKSTANPDALRYQNDSPFANAELDGGSSGLESLMGLDRSHIQDVTLRQAPWYQAGLAREIALDILQQEEVGHFIVRDSSTHPGCYALSVRVPKFENSSGISHYLILRTHRGVKLKGLDKEWSNLTALVTHHTVMREMLPCTLRLPKSVAAAPEDDGGVLGFDPGNYTELTQAPQLKRPDGC